MKRILLKLLSVLIVILVVSLISLAQEETQEVTEGELQSMDIVLDLERPSNTDILLLRNGDKLTGTVLNDTFSIRTSYASLNFSNRIIAGIDLEGGANNIEAIVTVNNNRFSGFIDDPMVVFKLQTGPQIEIRREKVLKVIFRVRESERRNIPQSQFVILKNGDYLSGNILNENLIIATTYAKVPLNLNDAESVTMIGGDSPLTKVLMKNNDIIQGVLETEDINTNLDIDGQIDIYQDRIDVLYCQHGFIPDLDETKLIGVIAISEVNDENDFHHEFTDNNLLLIKTVPEKSPYYGKLLAGDIVIAINGKTYEPGMLRPLQEKVISGEIHEIILTVLRGEKEVLLKIIK